MAITEVKSDVNNTKKDVKTINKTLDRHKGEITNVKTGLHKAEVPVLKRKFM